jgi:hypothetical protein
MQFGFQKETGKHRPEKEELIASEQHERCGKACGGGHGRATEGNEGGEQDDREGEAGGLAPTFHRANELLA